MRARKAFLHLLSGPWGSLWVCPTALAEIGCMEWLSSQHSSLPARPLPTQGGLSPRTGQRWEMTWSPGGALWGMSQKADIPWSGPVQPRTWLRIQAGSGTGVSTMLDREAWGAPVLSTPCRVLLAGPPAPTLGRSRLRAQCTWELPHGAGAGAG